ncbi:MAG: hypothetical protein ACOX2N_04660 [Peptococcia bacterium]|jgi:hypothetical protein
MKHKKKNPVDTTALSKKYKCDVNKIIRAWKKEITDHELSKKLGINKLKLMQIRQEIASIHERERQRSLQKKFSTKTSLLFKPW